MTGGPKDDELLGPLPSWGRSGFLSYTDPSSSPRVGSPVGTDGSHLGVTTVPVSPNGPVGTVGSVPSPSESPEGRRVFTTQPGLGLDTRSFTEDNTVNSLPL